MEGTRLVDSRREQVANKPGNHLYARKPRRNEKDFNCNDCRRTRLSLCCVAKVVDLERHGTLRKLLSDSMGVTFCPKFETKMCEEKR